MSSIKENLSHIRQTIPQGVTLVCVSKFHPAEAIQEAYDCGERVFGESRVQELTKKQKRLTMPDIKWHFIGHLQTNKVRQVVGNVAEIDSVDSLHLLEQINRVAKDKNIVQDILIEVHIGQETTKTGLSEQDLPSLLGEALRIPNIKVMGLMGMASNTDDEKQIRQEFSRLKKIFETCFQSGDVAQTDGSKSLVLSMGMSDDYLIAIEEGSTQVRIGSKIFGERS